jgi:hypothetical protein
VTERTNGALDKPRSICDRYELEIPIIAASRRIGSSANSRCRRIASPSVE